MSLTLREASKDTLQAEIKPGTTIACRWLPERLGTFRVYPSP